MEMTQKQIEIEAQNYLNGLDLPENADKQLIVDNFKNGMAWAIMLIKEDKQRFIEWATEWLDSVRLDYYSENIKEFIEKFKKDAEEQL